VSNIRNLKIICTLTKYLKILIKSAASPRFKFISRIYLTKLPLKPKFMISIVEKLLLELNLINLTLDY